VSGFAIETISEELCPREEKPPQEGRKTLTKKRRVFSYANDDQEAVEFAETAVWAVEAALVRAETIGIVGLIKSKTTIQTNRLCCVIVCIRLIENVHFLVLL
jgi:hypothetical protein